MLVSFWSTAAGAADLAQVLLALAAIVVVARCMARVFGWLRQPPVMGEVLAGILLGPSLLGAIWPAAQTWLMPDEVAPFLGLLAQFGIVLYMFLVGLEVDLGRLRRHSRTTLVIAQASIVVPFALGAGLGVWLYPEFRGSAAAPWPFALFCGVAMAVTAFPVLARILADRQARASELGSLALAVAALNDFAAWILLALVVGLVNSDAGGGLVTGALACGFLFAMLGLVKPRLTRYVRRREAVCGPRTDRATLAVLMVLLLLAALLGEWIGIHALFGAFLLGALVPADSSIARDLVDRLEDFVVVVFLPAFFAYTGLRTELGLLSGWWEWLWCLAIVLVACLGKFGGTYVAARRCGLAAGHASALGVLLNTRGLMELIVLNVGLDLGVLSPTLFAMFVVMALATTLVTAPVVDRLARRRPLWGDWSTGSR